MATRKKSRGQASRSRARRHTPDLEAVIDETIRLLDTVGETGLRIEELLAATKLSKSSLYLHFTDRDGLISAARARQFEQIVDESIAGIRQLVSTVSTREDARRALHAATVFTQNLNRQAERVRRVAIVAGTVGRPAYKKSLTGAQTRLTDALTEMFAGLRARGLINSVHPDRTIAAFVQAYTFGRVLAGFDSKLSKDDDAQWVSLIDDAVEHILFN